MSKVGRYQFGLKQEEMLKELKGVIEGIEDKTLPVQSYSVAYEGFLDDYCYKVITIKIPYTENDQ